MHGKHQKPCERTYFYAMADLTTPPMLFQPQSLLSKVWNTVLKSRCMCTSHTASGCDAIVSQTLLRGCNSSIRFFFQYEVSLTQTFVMLKQLPDFAVMFVTFHLVHCLQVNVPESCVMVPSTSIRNNSRRYSYARLLFFVGTPCDNVSVCAKSSCFTAHFLAL